MPGCDLLFRRRELVPGFHVGRHRAHERAGGNEAGAHGAVVATLALDVPAVGVGGFVFVDIGLRGLGGDVDRQERQVGEEGFAVLRRGVDVADQPVDEELRGIEVLRQVGGLAVLEPVSGLVERQIGPLLVIVAAGGVEREGAVESPGVGQVAGAMAQVPLAGHPGMVARALQQGGDGGDILRQVAPIGGDVTVFVRGALGQVGDAGGVAVDAGQQHGPRGRAHGRGVEIGEPRTACRQAVDVGRRDLAAIGTEVRVAPVIDHNENNVGRGCRGGLRQCGGRRGQGQRERQR